MNVKRTLSATLLAAAVLGAIAFATLRARNYACVSFEPGLRGEAMRGDDGQFLYFNGECWTRKPMAPTDTPG